MARTRGCIWLAAGLIVALLAGIVAYVTLSRATVRQAGPEGGTGPTVPVVVAAQAVRVRTVLTAEMLVVKQVPVETSPEGAIPDVAQAAGKITLVDLFPGEIVLAQRLADPNVISGNGRLAVVVAEDEVLVAFPASDLMSRMAVLKPGDRVDLLVTLEVPANRALGEGQGAGAELATLNLLQNVAIAAVVSAPGDQQQGEANAATGIAGQAAPASAPQALLLTISPQDALTVKFAKDMGGIFDLALRAPGADQEVQVDPVDIDFLINKYRIPTGIGR